MCDFKSVLFVSPSCCRSAESLQTLSLQTHLFVLLLIVMGIIVHTAVGYNIVAC